MQRVPFHIFEAPGDDGQRSAADLAAIAAQYDRPRRHLVLFVLFTAAMLNVGLALGNNPTPAHFSWLFPMAFASTAFTVGMFRRLVVSSSLAFAGAAGFVISAPEFIHGAQFGAQVGFLAGTVAMAFAIGSVHQELRVSDVVQRRRLEEQEGALAAVNSGLETRVATQRAELRALAFHLANVTDAEQRGLRREVRGDLVPEIDRLSDAVALIGRGGAGAAGVLDRADAAMENAHLVFRRVLRRLHPNVVQRIGLAEAVSTLVSKFRRQSEVPVELSWSGLPPGAAPRTAELIYSAVRDGLRRWEVSGVVDMGLVTLDESDDGLLLNLTAEGEFEPEQGVSVLLVGLRERAAAQGGTVQVTTSAALDGLTMRIPHNAEVRDDSVGVDVSPVVSVSSSDGFLGYVKEFQSNNFSQYTWLMFAMLLLWWPFDFLVIEDEAMVAAMARFRLSCILLTGAAAFVGPIRRRCIEEPVVAGTLVFVAAMVLSGFSIGSAGTLAGGWAHYFAFAPALFLPFILPMSAQLVTSLVVTSAGLLGFFAARPEDFVGPESADLIVFTLVSIAAHMLVGQALHTQLRTGYHLGRKLERNRAALRDRKLELSSVVRHQTSELRERVAAMQSARDHERSWMVHEMHDGLGQIVASLGYALARVRRATTTDDVGAGPESAQEAQELAKTLQEELGRILAHLAPRAVDVGLPGALDALLRSFAPTGALRTELVVDLGPAKLDPDLRLLAYRVVQEGLTNILKHAQASRVRVDVVLGAEGLTISVLDDGVGLPRDPDGTGLGLPR